MAIRYEGAVLFVSDIEVSRRFYEQVMGQKLVEDHGPHLVFESGFFLWQADHARSVIHGNEEKKSHRLGQDNLELYFESEDLDGAWEAINRHGVSPVHETVEHPWGQRAFRIYDPDGHVIEVGEPLAVQVKRLHGQGLGVEEIAKRNTIPIDFVKRVLKEEE
ncbi:VOC family protein [Desulfovibrio oxyclinae]|uniref:VOC family protein n=1 Tax=Desulfovibrio oxyclinae TaxID=63560 RepID=UPI00037C837F|nr:VOC family protein [Desulfovibrio oxyclinae]